MHKATLGGFQEGWLLPRLLLLRARWKRLSVYWQLFKRQPMGILGLVLIALFCIMSLVHPILMAAAWDRARYDPIVGFDVQQIPHPAAPSAQHLLGTDGFGRDVLSQLLASTKTSFGVGFIAAGVAVVISTLVGGMAGYFGGAWDVIFMGVADVFVMLPAPIVLLILGLLVRLEWPAVALLYGVLTGLGSQAIIVKAHTLALRLKPFIEAAQVAGGGDLHIIHKHLLPGLVPLAIVNAFLTVVGAVLTESLLAFFSRTSYYLSWGMMIWLGQETFRLFDLRGQWHVIIPPALAIMLFCSAFYLVGRVLEDIFNPRLRRER